MTGAADKRPPNCSICGSENDAEAKFCNECSAPLFLRCPVCGLSNRTGAKFCGGCAASLQNATIPKRSSGGEHLLLPRIVPGTPLDHHNVYGERRHLTVLFCDLVGSTEMAAKLDPEDWHETLTSYHDGASGAVERFGGHVAQYLGDGLLVFFGYPEAHEDDPQRAVLAGLAILEAVAAQNGRTTGKQRLKLAVRVGIHSGSVVVDESGGKGVNVFGDVPNVASRIQTAAAPDTVLISSAVHHLVSGLFVVEQQGAQQLKGIDNPVQLYRAVQPSGARGRLAASGHRGLTPFIGRDDELRLLLNRWDQVREGEGQVVLIFGEAGIGKSRLVQHFHKLISDAPHIWVECAAASLHQNTPFYAVEDLLQQGFRWRREQNDEERLAGLEASLRLAGVKLSEGTPLIAPLMNLPVPAKYPPLAIPPEQVRKRLMATIAAWTLGTARIQPLVIVVEDLHWADPSTLEATQLLVEQGATAPLLLICTARPEFRAPWPLRANHAVLSLNRLSARNTREMAARLTSGTPLPAATVEAVAERSGGVPLFVEELIQTVVESVDVKPELREIPATLHDSLMSRLDRLGEGREVAQIASVIGNEFSWRLLRAISPVPDEKLNASLKKLADAQLLFEQGMPPEAVYKFRHALIQDAAYQSLLRTKRQEYHHRIAQVLEVQFPDTVEAQPHLLAHHYTEADLGEKAIPLWHRAGEKAVQRSANAEAVSHLAKALELLKSQPESSERFQQELELQLALGTPLIATKGFGSPQVGEVYARARELCMQAGDSPRLFPVLWGLWAYYTGRAEHEVARDIAEQCLRMAEGAKDEVLLLEAHHVLGVTLTGLAEFVAGLEHLEHVIVHHDTGRPDALAFGQDPKVVCLAQAAWTLWVHGFPDQAVKRNDEAIALAQKLNHPHSLAAALSFGAIVPQLRGDAQATEDLAAAAVKLSTEQEFGYWLPWGFVLRGWATTQRGQFESGIAQTREGVAAFRATGAEVMVPYFLGLLAEEHAKAGQPVEALDVLAEAEAVVGRSRERWWEAELYRLKGELILMQSTEQNPATEHQKEAEQCFFQALNVASRQNAKSLELRAAMSLGRLWLKQGRRAEAHRMLAETYDWFVEGFETPDLREAKVLLDALS
jgi:class 3 adenylate cyclase/predicted ATPase